MDIHLFGVRGSLPTPGPRFVRYGGNTSSVGIAPDDDLPNLILDAGTGLATTRALFAGAPFRGAMLLGHLHWDHIYGLPFFSAGDRPDASADLYLPAQGGAIEVLERPMSPPVFPIGPTGLRGAWTFNDLEPGDHEIAGYSVKAREIPHKGGRAFGYRVSDGRHAVAYLSDHSPTTLGPGPDGIGEYHEAAVALAEGVDLLIHDSQYTPEEFESRRDWGHCSYHYPIELARRVGVRRTLLFHHDPSRTDDALDALAAGLPPTVEVAIEGTVIHL